ncbi:MAG TPA: O-antigen ligase family protein, partial [Anaerolineales bacterium]|nr:O-antigen ligase family protein [Anaerolineales bacterium]
ILWSVTGLYPLGIYAFCRIFNGKISASYAALASAILLPIYVTAHIFGQLPFLASTLTALFAAAGLHRYLREGGIHNFTLSVVLVTSSMAMHHATLMVHPFLFLAVITDFIFRKKAAVRKDWQVLFKRLFLFSIFSATAGFMVIFPFWQWGTDQVIQTPIDHLSRHNFFRDPLALAIFLFPLYGPFIVIIPFLFRKWQPRFWGLQSSFFILFLLGLGGTTPLPHLLFSDAWEWLTYDRFAFWACLTLFPFFGKLFLGLKKQYRSTPKQTFASFQKKYVPSLVFASFFFTAIGAWFTPHWFPIQPKPVDMQPIVDFLNTDHNSHWRYVTFGFGDQFAYLNLLTPATTIDGSYHTARTLPELRNSGIGQIDTSYWAVNGMKAIVPILAKSGEHSVRWGFVNPDTIETVQSKGVVTRRSPFVPVLDELGWRKIKTLANGIFVYENPGAIKSVAAEIPAAPPINSFAWGVFPLIAFVTALSLGMLRVYPAQTEWILRKVYAFAIGLLPITLCFWLYRVVGEFSHPRVYFTYDNALFFLSDGLAVLAVILWLSVKVAVQSSTRVFDSAFINFRILLPLIFLLYAALSIFWSQDWRTSLYISLHLGLIFFRVLSLRERHETRLVAMYGLCAALSIQLVAGFIGYAQQSTAFLDPLNMKWPGLLEPSMQGASVVQMTDGLRVLRAYGTLPHPNILGGFTFLALLGPASLFLRGKTPNYAAIVLFCAGIVLIVLTYSRATWLALTTFMLVLILKSKYFEVKKRFLLPSAAALAFAFSLYLIWNLVSPRISAQQSPTETISNVGRSWLTQQAMDMIRRHPITGAGIGSLVIELAQTAAEGAPIEPVHNIFLLAASELGLIGFFLIAGLFVLVVSTTMRARTPQAILVSAALAGAGVISLFDHYFWTLAPGRMMLGLVVGLWAGEVAHDP